MNKFFTKRGCKVQKKLNLFQYLIIYILPSIFILSCGGRELKNKETSLPFYSAAMTLKNENKNVDYEFFL